MKELLLLPGACEWFGIRTHLLLTLASKPAGWVNSEFFTS
jgi:hypothetical protein